MELNQQFVSELSKKLYLKPEVLSTVLTSTDPEEVKGVLTKVNALHVFNDDQLKTRMINDPEHGYKAGSEKGASEATINTYVAQEKRLAEKYGIEKKEGEKLAEIIDRIISEKTQGSSKPSEELKRLQEQLSEKNTALQNALTNADKIKSEYEAKEKSLIIDSRISELVSGLPIDADENLISAQREFVKFSLKNKYDVDQINGQIIFKDKITGKELRNPTTADFKEPAEIVKEFAPTVVRLKQDKVPKNGTGLQTTAISKEGLGSINFTDYANASALEKHLLESGHAIHDPKVQEVLSKYLESDHGKATVKPGAAIDLY